ncbi:MAG: hypothetical protein JSW05_04040 [Candidatus Thorarchaeota archaeon]|nr:MAG: hypothetical protein JSW05_04040 [Candidatus Thorarchaeota archaeon]
MEGIAELMKGYWIDKRDHPWHRLCRILGRDWKKTGDPTTTSKKLMLLREGVFGALGILSLSLPLDFSTEQVLKTLTRAKSWKEGRQKVRGKCVKLAMEMISKTPDRDHFLDVNKLKIMTFDTCQGEERDIIFYSMVATGESDRLWGVFIKNLADVD